jgi:tetratricopeptide (TPR) repeat protein
VVNILADYLNDYDKAIADFNEALRINPNNTTARGNLDFITNERNQGGRN